MKKLSIIIVVIALIAAGGWWTLGRLGSAAAADEEAPKTATIGSGEIELLVEATGEVVSNRDVEIKSKASGTVVKLPYDVSSKVVAFDGKNADKALLVALDPSDEQRRVQQSEAAVAAEDAKCKQAQTNLEMARSELATQRLEIKATIESASAKADLARKFYEQRKRLLPSSAATQDEVDDALSQSRIADADLQTAKAKEQGLKTLELTVDLRQRELELCQANLQAANLALDDARNRLQETSIYCPINGVVSKRNVQVGTIVASGINNVGGGTTLMVVSDYSHVYVNAEVNENDVGSLLKHGGEGKDVTITVESYGGEKFRGKVVNIAPDAKEEANVITYPVKIEVIDRDKLPLYAKMTAHVKIHVVKHDKALLVPLAAVRYDGDQAYVEMPNGEGEPRRVDVKLGINNGKDAQVLSGLKEGDEVLTGAAATKWSNDGRGNRVRMNPRGGVRVR